VTLLEVDVERLDRAELPAVLGRLVELEWRIRLRLTEAPASPSAPEVRLLDSEAAAVIAGTSERWLLSKTRGLAFRRDLSRKQPRFDEAGLRSWLNSRSRRG
jgi:hypothetical protein